MRSGCVSEAPRRLAMLDFSHLSQRDFSGRRKFVAEVFYVFPVPVGYYFDAFIIVVTTIIVALGRIVVRQSRHFAPDALAYVCEVDRQVFKASDKIDEYTIAIVRDPVELR